LPISIPIATQCRPQRSDSFTRGVVGRVIITLGFGLGVFLGGCSVPEAPTLQKAGAEPGSDFGATIPNVAAGEPMTFGFIPLCVGSNTGVTVTAASFEESTNLEVVGFAVENAPRENDLFGAEKVTLANAGFDVTKREVSASCPNDGDFLGLELRRVAEPATGRGDRLVLTYTEEDGQGQTTIPFYVVLCAPTDITDECS
jgi:hypothetical protein